MVNIRFCQTTFELDSITMTNLEQMGGQIFVGAKRVAHGAKNNWLTIANSGVSGSLGGLVGHETYTAAPAHPIVATAAGLTVAVGLYATNKITGGLLHRTANALDQNRGTSRFWGALSDVLVMEGFLVLSLLAFGTGVGLTSFAENRLVANFGSRPAVRQTATPPKAQPPSVVTHG